MRGPQIFVRVAVCWQTGAFRISQMRHVVETGICAAVLLFRILPVRFTMPISIAPPRNCDPPMQLLLPLASIHEVRLSSGDAEARVQGRWRFAMAVISAALSLAWCVGASWFFAGDSAVHMLLGMGMICAVGAGSFVYVSLIVLTCAFFMCCCFFDLWTRSVQLANRPGLSSGHVHMGQEQVQTYAMALLLVALMCLFALTDIRRQQRERFRRQYMQERLRVEREERRTCKWRPKTD